MLKVNEYFDGKAKSIAFQTSSLPATVGVISPGEYEFGTSKKETMTVISGVLTVLLPGMEEWMTYGSGEFLKWRDRPASRPGLTSTRPTSALTNNFSRITSREHPIESADRDQWAI